jgi:hypothetical protein
MENLNRKLGIHAIASFGDDPSRVEGGLPMDDINQMLSEVSTKPQFRLCGMNMHYSYAEEVLATLPPMPGNTLLTRT